MKKVILITILAAMVALTACSKDYSRDIIGTWDAGRATLEKNMTVVIKGGGTLTAEIKDLGMKPVKGTYALDGNNVVFSFSSLKLSYKILTLDKKTLVMKHKYARITWKRIK